MREIDRMAMKASKDRDLLQSFVQEYEGYILKCASKTARRFITKNDDEWSVALEAFCSAVETYVYERGNFLKFSEMVIRRRLIDFFRRQSRFQLEISVDPAAFSGETEEHGGANAVVAAEIACKTSRRQDDTLKEEILAAGAQLSSYGFSFYDLIHCSPKARKTKEHCLIAVRFLVSDPGFIAEMRRTKTLPLKTIEAQANIPRKILERHRKYIIAAAEILTGDYPGLSAYMQRFRKEQRE